MRRTLRNLVVLAPLALASGCHLTAPSPSNAIAADRSAMPPNTVMLSDMMRELSAQPGFTEQLLAQLNKGDKNGAFLTPKLFDELRRLILGKDWGGLDRFPGWTTKGITRTVDLAGVVAGKSTASSETTDPRLKKLFDGRSLSDEEIKQLSIRDRSEKMLKLRLMGMQAWNSWNYEDLPKGKPFQEDSTSLGSGVIRGDGPDPRLAPLRPESQRLADVLNLLSVGLPAIKDFTPFNLVYNKKEVSTPEALINALIQSGHQVTVADVRYFANFGHFHYKGQDVLMPFWINTGWAIPTDHWWQKPRPLLVPVAHAEYEWIITGPKINADVTFYFGIDGKAEFRTNDWLNQPWVMGRHAHEYRGAQAVEVTRLVGKFVRAYSVLHARHPDLPFGGYYALGVCQDSIGAIEMRMTGKTTLFPNTARTEFFHDQPDDEITKLMEAVPKDDGKAPDADRIFGSLPTEDFARITVPGLRDDVQRSYAAWQQGKLQRVSQWRWNIFLAIGMLIATVAVLLLAFRRRMQ